MPQPYPTISTYDDALAELRRALVFGIQPSLESISKLVRELGQPDATYASIQVTGTNGKTSTTRLIDALLRASGQKSGLYTSPELIDYTERIEVDGHPIAPQTFADNLAAVCAVRDELSERGEVLGSQVTEFELLTALALLTFAREQRDFAVLEVGMGGRWDATSVVNPSVAVITSVGLDHMKYLGNTIEEIAADKAMIIKPGTTPVIGAHLGGALEVVLARCEEVGAHPRLVCVGDEPSAVIEERTTRVYLKSTIPDEETLLKTEFSVKTPHAFYENLCIKGPAYQAVNAATALTAAESALGRALRPEDIARAFDQIRFPARFEVLGHNPLLMFDGGHNPQAASLLAQNLELAQLKPVIAFGVFADKDYRAILKELGPYAQGFIALQNNNPRALPVGEVAQAIKEITQKPVLGQLVSPTLEEIQALSKSEPLLITGSLSLYVLLKSYITAKVTRD